MDVTSIKRFAELYRRYMGPSEADCSDKQSFHAFADNYRTIRQNDRQYYANERRLSEAKAYDTYHYNGMTLMMFLLTCVPVAVTLVYADAFGAMAWMGYLVTGIALGIRGFFSAMENRGMGVIPQIFLLVLCFVADSIFRFPLLGSSRTWALVFLLGGSGITVLLRRKERKRMEAHTAECEAQRRDYEQCTEELKVYDALLQKTAEAYCRFGDIAKKQLQEEFPQIELDDRTAWFAYMRGEGNPGSGSLKSKTCFREIEPPRDRVEETERCTSTYRYEGFQQSIGVITMTKTEAMDYIHTVEPFFNLIVPEWREDFVYIGFHHDWSYTEYAQHHYHYIDEYVVKDQAMIDRFDDQAAFEEMLHLGTDIDSFELQNNDIVTQHHIDRYRRKKEKRRKQVERDATRTVSNYVDHTTNKTNREWCHELAYLIVTTKDGEFIGAYAHDSNRGIEMLMEELNKITTFELTPWMMPKNGSQRAFWAGMFL